MRKQFGYVLLALVMLVVLAFVVQRTSTKATLRRYLAELRIKGEKLAGSELFPVCSTNPEHIVSRNFFATNIAAGTFIVPEVMKFVDDGKARIGWKGDLHWEGMSTNKANSSDATWKALEEQNKQQATNLELFRRALKNPSPDLGPHTNFLNTPKLNIPLERHVAQSFLADEMENLHHGHPAAALEDVEEIIALISLNKDEPTLPVQMMRNAIANLGLFATWELMQSPDLNEEMLSRLQREWQEIDLFAALEKGFLGERAYGYEMLTMLQTYSGANVRRLFAFSTVAGSNVPPAPIDWSEVWDDHIVFPLYKMTSSDDDGLFYLKSMQNVLDSARMLKSSVPWPTVKVIVTNQVHETDKTFARDKFHRYRFSELANPNYSRAMELVVHAETLRRLTITAIALKRYQLGHGAWPNELKLLTPGILSEVPIDPMSGKPVCYRFSPDGHCVLYSVGEDGRDDGGVGGGKDLWLGKDAVWPTAVDEDADAALAAHQKVN
ncbi:hypothetical protein [Pedosphaera parvula]|uniref:Uncharacterized protein n=1 Tax=Pedosphaera parvula (strain Ellin514) TaxID=320771 RepID=B9XP96_PEDPL|nr:hypothetical protein [Pedosphaera parvula]EEF58347.1 hypothetical protein Cflav_PD1286 [Pedosphaera parvula Ellin514]